MCPMQVAAPGWLGVEHSICVSETNFAETSAVVVTSFRLPLQTNLHVAVELFTNPDPVSVTSVLPAEGPQEGVTDKAVISATSKPITPTGWRVISSSLPISVATRSKVLPKPVAEVFWKAFLRPAIVTSASVPKYETVKYTVAPKEVVGALVGDPVGAEVVGAGVVGAGVVGAVVGAGVVGEVVGAGVVGEVDGAGVVGAVVGITSSRRPGRSAFALPVGSICVVPNVTAEICNADRGIVGDTARRADMNASISTSSKSDGMKFIKVALAFSSPCA